LNKRYLKLFNSISFILCVLSALVLFIGRHVKHFCTYNDTSVFLQGILNPSSNPDIILGCLPHFALGFIAGILFDLGLVVISRLFPDRFSLSNKKNVISLLGFSVLLFSLCVNHMSLELQFVLKSL